MAAPEAGPPGPARPPARDDLPGSLKILIVWLLVGTAIFLAWEWYEREKQRTSFHVEGDVIEIRRGDDGHYHWPGALNGRAVDFLVDTGASGVAIPAALALELKLDSEGQAEASTAGGSAIGQVMRADLTLKGGVRVERLRVLALPGLADHPLLGMDVLGRLRWRQEDGVLRIDLRSGAG